MLFCFVYCWELLSVSGGFDCSAWLCGCLALRLWLLVLLVAGVFCWIVSGLCLDFDLMEVGGCLVKGLFLVVLVWI